MNKRDKNDTSNCSGFKQEWKGWGFSIYPLLHPPSVSKNNRKLLILVWPSLEINSEKIIDLKVTQLMNGKASLGYRCAYLRCYMRIILFVVVLLGYNIRRVIPPYPLYPAYHDPEIISGQYFWMQQEVWFTHVNTGIEN